MKYTEPHRGRFLPHPANPNMLSISKELAVLLRHTPLYMVDEWGTARVIKAAGGRFTLQQIMGWGLDLSLYLAAKHKGMAISEIQSAMLDELLVTMSDTGDVKTAKAAMVTLVEQTFLDPKMALLQNLCGVAVSTMDRLCDHPDLLKAFMLVSGKGYLLAEHSVNVMASAMLFSLNNLGSKGERDELCLAALLHDVGRLDLPERLILPSQDLSEEDFALVKRHPLLGKLKLEDKGFIDPRLLQGIEEHHERLDGSGYPKGTRHISVLGQILGLADSFDALTGYAKAHKGIVKPMEALERLKEEADQGKFDRFFLTSFAYSLAS